MTKSRARGRRDIPNRKAVATIWMNRIKMNEIIQYIIQYFNENIVEDMIREYDERED